VHVATCLILGTDGTVYVGGYSTLGFPPSGVNANQYGGGSSDGFVVALSQLAGQPVGSNQPLETRKSTPRPPRY
jgi:hypothetical protein